MNLKDSKKLIIGEDPKDEVLNGLKRFTQAKLTGVVTESEFANIYGKTLGLLANCFRIGKLSFDSTSLVERIERWLVSENIYPKHQGLDIANVTFKEDLRMGIFSRSSRFSENENQIQKRHNTI